MSGSERKKRQENDKNRNYFLPLNLLRYFWYYLEYDFLQQIIGVKTTNSLVFPLSTWNFPPTFTLEVVTFKSMRPYMAVPTEFLELISICSANALGYIVTF